jgi:hypothetical protein
MYLALPKNSPQPRFEYVTDAPFKVQGLKLLREVINFFRRTGAFRNRFGMTMKA